jgi:hypothetical protein
MAVNDNNSLHDHYFWLQAGVLIAGFCTGIIAAYFIAGHLKGFPADTTLAKQLGITSVTIINNYSKSRDIINYLVVLGVPIIGALGFWSCWFYNLPLSNRQNLINTPPHVPASRNASWLACLLAVIFIYLFFVKNLSLLHYPNYGWVFLGEEGVNLAWAQNILAGRVYARDFKCEYAPALIYPLAWAMKLFEPTVLLARGYTHALNIITYAIIILFLYKTIAHKSLFVCSSIVYLLAFPPFLMMATNSTYLRVALGIFPILLAYLYKKQPNRLSLTIIGFMLGVSLLFSQEVGICSTLGVIGFFLTDALFHRRHSLIYRQAIQVVFGLLLSIGPTLAYFYSQDALSSFIANLFEYPRLFALGFVSLPFPDFQSFIKNPLAGNSIFHYWVIFIYSIVTIRLGTKLIKEKPDRNDLLIISILIFGILLFRSALGRSDSSHVLFCSSPAFLLCFLIIDQTVISLKQSKPVSIIGKCLLPIFLVSTLLLLFYRSDLFKQSYFCIQYNINTTGALLGKSTLGIDMPELPRAGVKFSPDAAQNLLTIKKTLDTYARPNDSVYFFPNEAAYYFLFNRNPPTRFMIAYQAITFAHRRDLIADLEKSKPGVVIYSKNTQRIDGIYETTQVPELVNYLTRKYRIVYSDPEFLLMKRRLL